MIYRVIVRLSMGVGFIEPGSMITDDRLGHRIAAILAKKGHISPIKAPPLGALPGWHLRSQKFEAAGYDAISLLETDTGLIARETGYQERSIDKWKKELMEFIEVRPAQVRRPCCEEDEAPEEAEPELEQEIEQVFEEPILEEANNATDN